MKFLVIAHGYRLIATLACLAGVLGVVVDARATVIGTTMHGASATSLDGFVASGDLLSGLIAAELPGDNGWHPANGDPLDKLPAFTDDTGLRATNLTGLLNDFPLVGTPTKLIQYDLGGLKNIAELRILSGNAGKDGRVFSTTLVTSSSDGVTFDTLGYFPSDASGTINSGQWGSTLVQISDDVAVNVLSDVRYLRFGFYAVDNTSGQYRDPFDGLNPYTGVDDGLTAAFVAPLIFEIDAIEGRSGGTDMPEPGPVSLLCAGFIALGWERRRRRRRVVARA
jgi:hypothetical protein